MLTITPRTNAKVVTIRLQGCVEVKVCLWLCREGDGTDKVDSSLEEVMEFINQQIEKGQEGTLLRGPYLAQMELVRILQERKSQLLTLAGVCLC